MLQSLKKSTIFYVIVGLYVLLLLWWAVMFFSGIKDSQQNYVFGFAYAIIALIGSINGFYVSHKWGGTKSLLGRGILYFSLGLLGLWWGQTVWSYFNVIAKDEVPYPSIADIGFFSVIPLYTLGILSFMHASGSKLSLKRLDGKLVVVFLPLLFVAIAYFLFIKNLQPDFSDPLRTFLDFGYPLGEAIPISLALVTYYLTKGVLGGKMKPKIGFLIVALIFHIITEYIFIYTAAAEIYYNAGPVDLMYMTSFTLMSLAILSFSNYD